MLSLEDVQANNAFFTSLINSEKEAWDFGNNYSMIIKNFQRDENEITKDKSKDAYILLTPNKFKPLASFPKKGYSLEEVHINFPKRIFFRRSSY